STPPSSPLSSWSSPLPQIPSPPLPPIPSPSLPISAPLPVLSLVPVLSPSPPASPIRLLDYLATMIWLRTEAASTSYLLPLPPPFILSYTRPAAPSSRTPPLNLLSTDRREDRPKVTLQPRKRLGIALGPVTRETRHDSERDVRYGITDLWDEIVETLQGEPVNASDLARAEVMSLRTTVLAQQSQIIELRLADCKRQTMISEILVADHRRQKQLTEALKLIKRLQTQMVEFKRQQGPAKGPAQPELPEEAGSNS
ncbi:hypothetical protein Tco_0036846, partial [Tanacetum coccineum]